MFSPLMPAASMRDSPIVNNQDFARVPIVAMEPAFVAADLKCSESDLSIGRQRGHAPWVNPKE